MAKVLLVVLGFALACLWYGALDGSRALARRVHRALPLWLVSSKSGRIVLHIVAALGDRQWSWHAAGIAREVLPRRGKRGW